MFREWANRATVYVGDVVAGEKQLSKVRRLTLNEGFDWPQAWTADGKAILFNSPKGRSPADFELTGEF